MARETGTLATTRRRQYAMGRLESKAKIVTESSPVQGLPDNNSIARVYEYWATHAAGDYLVLFDTRMQKWTTLLALGVGYPTWSRDSRYIYCNTLWRKDSALIRVTVKNGQVETFTVNFVAA
jgi:hypothetical protein